jgi:neuromedin U receptor 1
MRSTWFNKLMDQTKPTRLRLNRIRHFNPFVSLNLSNYFLVSCLFLAIKINQIECDVQLISNQTQNNEYQNEPFSIPFSSSTTRKTSETTGSQLDSNHELILNQSSIVDSNVLILNRSQYLESLMGQRYKSIEFVVFMGTIYSLILLCGIVGNLSTCFVVITNNCLHTTTNYYLFSLAVSDVLLLLSGLPPEMYNIFVEAYPWPTGQTFCVLRTFIFEMTTIASVLTILTFTFERWLHICKAIYAKKFSSGFTRALKIIIFIWLLSCVLALPYLFTSGVYFEEHEYPESKLCGILKPYKNFMVNIIQLSVVFLFIVPMTLISIMYVLIGVTLWRSHAKRRAQARHTKNCWFTLKLNSFFKLKNKENKKQQQQAHQESSIKKSDTSECLTKISVPNECKLNRKHSKSIPNISINFMKSDYDIKCEFDNSKRRTTTTLDTNKHIFNERASKDFEHISYRTRQSRRDVVKMLCNYFSKLLLSI